MIIKLIGGLCASFLIAIGFLRKRVKNKNKTVGYLAFTTAWAYVVFTVLSNHSVDGQEPEDYIFYIAYIPQLLATALLIVTIK